MKKLLIFSLFCSSIAYAQQEPINEMYWNNYSVSNPAMSGVQFKHEANVTHRNEWSRVNNSPRSWFVNYALNLRENHGLGVNYVIENSGFSRTNYLKLNYNYQFNLKEERTFVVGAALSYSDADWMQDWCFSPCVLQGPQRNFQVDFGVAYYSENIIAGLAVTQFPITRNSLADTSACYIDRRVQLTGNFRLEGALIDMPKFMFETKIQSDLVNYRQDFNLGYKPKTYLEVGVGYRTTNAISLNLTGIIAKKYRIGYSYAHSLNQISSYSRNTHEIAIGLRIPTK